MLTWLWIALMIFFLLVLVQRKSLFSQGGWLAFFFAVFFLDNLLILLPNSFSKLQIIPNTTWGGFLICCWSGKLYSIACMAALLFLFRAALSREEVGLTFRLKPAVFFESFAAVLFLSAWALLAGFSSPKGDLDILTLVYLALIPGINEELVYRGILFSILLKIFSSASNQFLTSTVWSAALTSLLFGLLHGFWLDGSFGVHLETVALRNSTISGLIFAWLRARTGSLVLPVLAHGLEDFLFFLPRMV